MAAPLVSRPIKASLGLLALVVVGVSGAKSLSSAEPIDQTTARLVTQMVTRFHINQPKINDDASSQLLDSYVDTLDPLHLYFLQSDIDGFNAHRTTLDDELTKGDVEFGYVVHDLYEERLMHQAAVAHQLIDAEHDFTVNEEKEADYTKLGWAKTQVELDERWRKFIKYDLLLARISEDKFDQKKYDEAREALHKRYRNVERIVKQREKFDKLEIYLSSLTSCFDPHSSYMSPQSYDDFQIDIGLQLDGIGASLRMDDGYTIVADIVPGGAADKDKRLKKDDKIVGVGQVDSDTGEWSEINDTYEVKLSNVVKQIRGKRGTTVLLKIQPKDSLETKVYDITREKIEIKESEARGEIVETKDRVGREGKIGVVSLPSFYRDFQGAQRGLPNFKSAARDLKVYVDKFRNAGVDAIIVDLRGNTGGALTESVEVTGEFIDHGPVVQVRDFVEPEPRILDDEEPGALWNGPLIIVCNRMSASASEIFAGAIKDYARGIIVGDTTTHGKGTVQNLMDIAPNQLFRISKAENRGQLKLTIQQFYRPNGESTQNHGVRSDIVLPSLLDHSETGEQYLDHALPFHAIDPAPVRKNAFVTPQIVASLAERSAERVQKDKEFDLTQQVIVRYLERKNRKVVSLNESILLKEKASDKALRETEEELNPDKPKDEDINPHNKPIFPDNFYNDELLNIALDYTQMLTNGATVKNR